jgi:hypothetical protein
MKFILVRRMVINKQLLIVCVCVCMQLFVMLLETLMQLLIYNPKFVCRRGLITRNVKDAVDLFHRRFGVSLLNYPQSSC